MDQGTGDSTQAQSASVPLTDDAMPGGQQGFSSQQKTDDTRDGFASSSETFVVKMEPPNDASFGGSTAPPMTDGSADPPELLPTSHVCQRCCATFVLFSSWELHMVTFHGDILNDLFAMYSAFKCYGVGYHYGDKSKTLSNHGKRRKRNGDDDDSNETDQKENSEKFARVETSADAGGLGAHSSVPASGKTYVCRICAKTFNQANSLNSHMRVHARPPKDTSQEKEPKKYVCDVCSKVFTRPDSLKKHELIHTGQKPYVCDVCDRAFTQSTTMKQHRVLHSGHRPFACDGCDKTFTRGSDLNRHRLSHLGSYFCEECQKTFSSPSALKQHRMIHSGHKPFVCDVCSKAFNQASALKEHKFIHVGYKSFVCNVCGKAFTQSGALKQHLLIHSGHKPHVCDVCNRGFTWAHALKRHQRTHTEECPDQSQQDDSCSDDSAQL